MRYFKATLILLLSITSLIYSSTPNRAILGNTDNRTEVYEETDPDLKELINSTCIVLKKSSINVNKILGTSEFSNPTLLSDYLRSNYVAYSMFNNYGRDVRFEEQNRVSGGGSGFIVGPNQVMTAGHVVNHNAHSYENIKCDTLYFIFDYQLESADDNTSSFDNDFVYRSTRIVRSELSNVSGIGFKDYAIIEVERAFDHDFAKPFKISKKSLSSIGSNMIIIGHPAGLPKKICNGPNDTITESSYNGDQNIFCTYHDVFPGNSGGPVINSNTKLVEGLVHAGEDFGKYEKHFGEFTDNGQTYVDWARYDNQGTTPEKNVQRMFKTNRVAYLNSITKIDPIWPKKIDLSTKDSETKFIVDIEFSLTEQGKNLISNSNRQYDTLFMRFRIIEKDFNDFVSDVFPWVDFKVSNINKDFVKSVNGDSYVFRSTMEANYKMWDAMEYFDGDVAELVMEVEIGIGEICFNRVNNTFPSTSDYFELEVLKDRAEPSISSIFNSLWKQTITIECLNAKEVELHDENGKVIDKVSVQDDGTVEVIVHDLVANTSTNMTLYAVYSDGSKSNGVVINTPYTYAIPPSNFNSNLSSTTPQTQIDLSWSQGIGSGYVLFSKALSSGTWTQLAELPITTLNYTHSGLSSNTTYQYNIVTKNDDGDYSTELGTKTQCTTEDNTGVPQDDAPSTPGSITFSNIQDDQATISWGASDRADYYTLKYGGIIYGQVISGTSATITGLTPETDYEIEIVAYDQWGQASPKCTKTLTTDIKSGVFVGFPGGLVWDLGTNVAIMMSYDGNVGSKCRVELYRDGSYWATYHSDKSYSTDQSAFDHWVTDGSVNQIEFKNSGDWNDNHYYQIKVVTENGDNGISRKFYVDNVDPVTINGGASVTYSKNVTVNFPSNSIPNYNVKISNFADYNDASWQTYSTSKSWTLSDGYGSKKVYIALKQSDTDILGKELTIEYRKSSINITSPKNGEVFKSGDTCNIQWATAGTVPSYTLKYSDNGGETYDNVITSSATGSNYKWVCPLGPVENGKILIQANSDATINDISDSTFSILSLPAITILSPNNDMVYEVGDTSLITWEAVGGIDSVQVYYSIDSMASWIEIVSNTTNDGEFSWVVPVGAISEEIFLKVSDSKSSAVDYSDKAFEVFPVPSLTLNQPTDNDTIIAGEEYELSWNYEGLMQFIVLEYSVDNGSTWKVIGDQDSTDNDGSFYWQVPEDTGRFSFIRISGKNRDSIADTINSTVSIIAIPKIELISPNGLESFKVGANVEINWNSIFITDSVQAYYSSDSGLTWGSISGYLPIDSSLSWSLPDSEQTISAMVKVVTKDGINKDSSDIYFSVLDDPRIVRDPTDTAVKESSDVSFTVGVNGEFLIYDWQYYVDSLGWISILSANNDSILNIENAQLELDGVEYRCVVYNRLSSDTSSSAQLTVEGDVVPIVDEEKFIEKGFNVSICPSVAKSGDENIKFYYTSPFGVNLEVVVLDALGEIIYKKSNQLPSVKNESVFDTWNLRKSNGQKAGNGTYITIFKVTDSKGDQAMLRRYLGVQE